jgi:hypothetical protein
MMVFTLIIIVIGIHNDNPVALAIKVIILMGHIEPLYRLFKGTPVRVMVTQAMIAGNVKVVIGLNEIHGICLSTVKITGMDDEIAVFFLRPTLEIAKILPGATVPVVLDIVQIGKQ